MILGKGVVEVPVHRRKDVRGLTAIFYRFDPGGAEMVWRRLTVRR